MGRKRFSIIVPVRGGGEYFRLCIESILRQDYPEFDLLVLDNGGTDEDIAWAKGLRDARINFFPAERDLSIEENWARIVAIPKNEFMTIIGHDDVVEPNYLCVMERLIARWPDAGLYHAHFRLIDERGRTIRSCIPMPAHETASEYLAARFLHRRDSFGTGYVMRSRAYDALGGIPGYKNLLYADDALWLALMKGSWKAAAAEECFSYRLHAHSVSGRADPNGHLAALEQYAQFLSRLAEDDPEVAVVLQRHGPAYFANLGHHLYRALLQEANASNRAINPGLLFALEQIMHKCAADRCDAWHKQCDIRVLSAINRLPGRKIIYTTLLTLYRNTRVVVRTLMQRQSVGRGRFQ